MKERVGQFDEGAKSILLSKLLQKQVQAACAIIMFFVMLLAASGFADTAYGQEAAVSLSGGGTFEKGDTIALTVQYTGGTFGSATGRVTYDSDILTYQSCSGAEAHGSGGTVVFNMSDGTGKESLRCKLKFKAVSAGKSDIKLSTSDIYNIDLTEMSASEKATSVTINNTASFASSNADLAALKVSEGQLSPAFSKNITAYTVKVGKNVEQCSITAVKEDSKAKLSVSGSGKLSVGDNVRKITVTAESGKTKTYVVTITRASKAEKSADTSDNTADTDSVDPDAQQTGEANDSLASGGDEADNNQTDTDNQSGRNSLLQMDPVTAYLLIAFGITLAALLISIILLQLRILRSTAKKSEGIERKERKKKT